MEPIKTRHIKIQKTNPMRKLIYYSLALFLIISCKPSIETEEWRGDQRTGIYNENNLLKQWPEEGLEEIFSIENLGNGYGSPIVSENFIYVAGELDSMAVLHCFDLSGKSIWKTNFGKEWTHHFPGSRSTPTLVDTCVYVVSGIGNLYCIQAESGNILWHKNGSEFDAETPFFGHSESIAFDEDMIFWTVGGPEYNVVALNRFSGELIWNQKAFGERSAYNSPCLMETSSGLQLITFTAYHIMGLDTETGELMWSHEQTSYPPEKREPSKGDTHGNTVVTDIGSVFYIAGDGNGGVRLNLSPGANEVNEGWRNEKIDGYMGGIVLIDDYLYCCGTRKKDLKSIDCETGEIVDSLKIGSGSVIAADDMLYYYNQKGELLLIKYDKGDMEVVSSFKITKGTKEHFAHPVIKNGIIYIRHGNALMAFDIREKEKA